MATEGEKQAAASKLPMTPQTPKSDPTLEKQQEKRAGQHAARLLAATPLPAIIATSPKREEQKGARLARVQTRLAETKAKLEADAAAKAAQEVAAPVEVQAAPTPTPSKKKRGG